MNNIDRTRSSFFPNSKTANTNPKANEAISKTLTRNDSLRAKEIGSNTSNDASVSINDAIKDFSRIKKAVDMAPEQDNSAKIAKLRSQINNGTYSVDYEALADRVLGEQY